jgi:hypothetical protein
MSELNICKTCNEHYGGLIYDLPKKGMKMPKGQSDVVN